MIVLKNRRMEFILVCIVVIGTVLLMFGRTGTVLASDSMWHIKQGQFFIENGTIPQNDVFSIHPNLQLTAHEWLFDVISYEMVQIGGYMLIAAAVILCIFGTFLICIHYKSALGDELIASVLLLMTVSAGIYKKTLFIPDTFAVPFLVFEIVLLMTTKLSTRKKLLFNIPMVIILCNLHGGMMTGYIAQIVVFIVINFIFCVVSHCHINCFYLYFLIETLLLGCLNPYGFNIYRYAFHLTKADIADYVADWVPYSVPGTVGAVMLVLMLMLIFFGNFRLRELKETDIVGYGLIFMWLIATLKYGRCINVFIYVYFLLGSQWVVSCIRYIARLVYVHYRCVFNIFKVALLLCVLLVLGIGFYQIRGFFGQSVNTKADEYITKDMAEYLRCDGRVVFNDETLGGWLIYKDVKVFCDGRLDLYIGGYNNNNIAIEAAAAMYSPEIMAEITDKYGINTLVLSNNTVYSELYSVCDDWAEIMQNEKTVIFSKKQ